MCGIKRVKAYVKFSVKLAVRTLARILFIFPLKQNQVMFSAYSGEKVACNPKSVYDSLRKRYPGKFKYVWVHNKDGHDTDLEPDVKVVKYFSLRWFYFRLTSQVVVDNYPLSYIAPRRRKQAIVQTWHAGGAYKRIGSAHSKYRIEQYSIEKSMADADLFVSSSRGFTRGTIEEGYHYRGEILNCGMPRNDIFFDAASVKKARDKVKQKYALDGMIVLYVPTFRGETKRAVEMSSVLDVL